MAVFVFNISYRQGVYMMKKLLLLLVFCSLCVTAQAAELQVLDGAITTGIESQMPVDQIQTYSADYGKLYCFTRIVGAQEPTEVTHVWFYQEQEMARVTLPVLSPDWRTYSSKRFLPQWAGDWKVIVEDKEGRPLADFSFQLD